MRHIIQKWSKEELPEICDPFDASVISEKVNHLQILAVKLREKRVANGALRLDQPKITFSMDRDTMLPQGFQLYEHRHSNKLIEEFMLLANSAVAKKIADTYPELALLRRHPEPKGDVMDGTLELLSKCGESHTKGYSQQRRFSIINSRSPIFRPSGTVEFRNVENVGGIIETP